MSNTRQILIAVAVMALVAAAVVGVVYAVSVFAQNNPSNAVYEGTSSLEVKLGGAILADAATVNWGVVEPSTSYTKSLSVKNTGTVPVVVTVAAANLPAGFSLTWASNGATLNAGETNTATLTLQTPASLTVQTYSWTMTTQGAAV